MTDWTLTEEGVREQPLWTGVGVATVAVKELRKLKFRGVPVVELLRDKADGVGQAALQDALLRALTGGDEE